MGLSADPPLRALVVPRGFRDGRAWCYESLHGNVCRRRVLGEFQGRFRDGYGAVTNGRDALHADGRHG